MEQNKNTMNISVRSTNAEENDNPQNAFTRLMAIPLDRQPIQECRMLVESMKEESTFEKNVFLRTRDIEVPNYVTSHRIKRQNFKNYERMLSYSRKKKNLEDYERRSAGKVRVQVKQNRAQTLKEFMDNKKIKMLTEQSKQKFKDTVIEGILKNDKTRQKLFDESILIERLYYIKREQMGSEVQVFPIPKKFRGVDPRHMRVPETAVDEGEFHRRKYVHYQKSFQYFKKALKTEHNQLKNRQKQNTLVLMNLMNHFKDQVLSSKDVDMSTQISQCIRRLFLKYASSGSQDVKSMYKKITKQNVYKLMDDFGLQYKRRPKIKEIIEKYQISQFYFMEIIYLLSVGEGKQFFSDTNQFIIDKILSQSKVYLPREWQLISEHQNIITKHLKIRKFKEKLEVINSSVAKLKHNVGYYNFDQMVEVMWMLKIYPFMISKKKLRFFYLYSQTDQSGLTIQNLIEVYLCIAVSREGDLFENIKQIVKMVISYGKTQTSS